MQPLTANVGLGSRPEILRARRVHGMAYGAVAGLAFAAATWGYDAYLLSQAHAFYPWIKLIIGAIICIPAGGLSGWFTARLEKGWIAVPLWLLTSWLFSWLTIALPIQIAPRLIIWLEPAFKSLLDYAYYEEFQTRVSIAYGWVVIFGVITGLLQLPLVEPAVFSTSVFGKVAPFLVCAVIMGINGIIVDSLNNEPLRSAVVSVDQLVQFAVEHKGQDVDPALARRLHLASLRSVQDLITRPRHLIVSNYDQWIGQVHVLVEFGGAWVDCIVVYNQPSFCKPLDLVSP